MYTSSKNSSPTAVCQVNYIGICSKLVLSLHQFEVVQKTFDFFGASTIRAPLLVRSGGRFYKRCRSRYDHIKVRHFFDTVDPPLLVASGSRFIWKLNQCRRFLAISISFAFQDWWRCLGHLVLTESIIFTMLKIDETLLFSLKGLDTCFWLTTNITA